MKKYRAIFIGFVNQRPALRAVVAGVQKELSAAKFDHSKAVAVLALELAAAHGSDEEGLFQAGLCHDLAKEWSPKKLFSFVRKNRFAVPDMAFIRAVSPNLLHAYAGAAFAAQKKYIRSANLQRAIQSHTLGRPGMSLEEKILFVADYTAYDRRFKKAKKLRALAFQNLDDAFKDIVQNKIRHVLERGRPVHIQMLRLWNSLTTKGVLS